MKTLLVMRHAKSDWDSPASRDHDRPLATRGLKAARRMGRFISDSGVAPELIITSTAVRAKKTAELAAEAGGWDGPITPDPNLYATDIERVLDAVAGTDPVVDRLLIAGHEPTWSSLVGWLIGGGRVSMPTAAVACLDFAHGGWADLGRGTCKLRWLVTPKTLKK